MSVWLGYIAVIVALFSASLGACGEVGLAPSTTGPLENDWQEIHLNPEVPKQRALGVLVYQEACP